MTEKMKNALANMEEEKINLEELVKEWNTESNKEAPSIKVLNDTKDAIDKSIKNYSILRWLTTSQTPVKMSPAATACIHCGEANPIAMLAMTATKGWT